MNDAARTLTVVGVGDICLAGVAGDPFEHVADALGADAPALVFGNLECCFATRGVEANKNVVFNADASSARYLERFDLLCLANNHVLDFGPDGLEDTLGVLDTHALAYAGAGRNASEAAATRWLDCGGVRVAAVMSVDATGGDAGKPTVSVLSVKAMADAVRAARTGADVVVASYHGGIELDTLPTPFMIRSLRGLIDAGADVVLAHHPHVLQPAERYRGGVIAYSLGNFVFDNRRYGDHAGLASLSTVLTVRVPLEPYGNREPSYRYTPVGIGDDFRPRVLTGDDAAAFTAHMDSLERGLAAVDVDALDTDRLRNITREVHQKSLRTLVRYAVRHFRDFTFRELVIGGWMVLKGMVRRGGKR